MPYAGLEDLYLHQILFNEYYADYAAARQRASMFYLDCSRRWWVEGTHHKFFIHLGDSAPTLHAQDTSFIEPTSGSYTLSWRDGEGTLHAQDFGADHNFWYIKSSALKEAQRMGQCSEVATTSPNRYPDGNVSGFRCQG